MWDIGVLFLISVPVFYIYGLVSLIRNVVNSRQSSKLRSRTTFLISIIRELTEKFGDHSLPIHDVIQKYKQELSEASQISPAPQVSIIPGEGKTAVKTSISNWYTENSINILLYIGAFLIVAAASIFVGYQWETYSGYTKSLILISFTCLWFVTGGVLFRLPKVAPAGVTFLAIGAMLIPFCGLGLYNFVLQGWVSSGIVWTFTSLASLVIYIILYIGIRRRLFTYLLSLGGLSLSLGLVNLSQLAPEYYVLGAIITALALLVLRILIPSTKETDVSLLTPFEQVANVMLPLSLVYGLVMAIDKHIVFTLPTTIALLLAIVYYLLFYYFSKKHLYLVAAEILGFAFIVVFTKWRGLETIFVLYSLSLVSFFYLGLAVFIKHKRLVEESDITLILVLFSLPLWYLATYIYRLPEMDQVIFSANSLLVGLLAAIYLEKPYLRYFAVFFSYITIFHLLSIWNVNRNYSPLLFIIFSYLWYGISKLFTDPIPRAIYTNSSLIGTCITVIISIIYSETYTYPPLKMLSFSALLATYTSGGMWAIESRITKRTLFLYIASGFVMLGYLFHIHYLNITEVQIYTFPLAIYFFVLAYLRRRAKDEIRYIIFESLALLVLLLPTLFQAWDTDGARFALLLGIEGTILILWGNARLYRTYLYIGTAAIVLSVLSQTYNYLLNLPRWAITGIGGILFLSLALYLLWYRKEQKKSSGK